MYFIGRNFDGPKFHVILMYFSHAILMYEKLTQHRHTYFVVFLTDKAWRSIDISFL